MSVITTVSGLQYEDKVVGEGAEAQAGNHVVVHYTGWLQNADGSAGAKFDSSKDRNQPFSLRSHCLHFGQLRRYSHKLDVT